MPGTTVLGWSKSSLLCCIFLPLIGSTPMLRLTVSLLLLLGGPEAGQDSCWWREGLDSWGIVGVDSGTSRGHNYQQICACTLSQYWWVLWTAICYWVGRAGAPSLTLLTSGTESSGSKQVKRRKSLLFSHRQTHKEQSTCMHTAFHKCTARHIKGFTVFNYYGF